MILNYNDIGHQKLEEYKKKKVQIKVFKPKEFDEYKKEMEQQEQNVTVVRNTKLKVLKDDDEDVKNGEYLAIGDKKYKLVKERGRVAVAYIPIDATRFVRIESNLLLFILLFGMGVGLFLLLTQVPVGEKPIIPLPDIEMDSNADDWDGEGNKPNDDSVAEQENITIPGFSTFKATKEANLIKLYNLPENTVNFIYTITKPTANDIVEEFDDIDEAQKYITKNTITYQNYYDETTKNYEVQDSDGNITDLIIEYKMEAKDDKYIIHKIQSEVIYFTKGIAPNMSIDWNVYEALGVGVHKLQFRISTYDINTNGACYGAIQDVVITIVE